MTLSTTWINFKNIMLRLRVWSVNSPGPASVINLSPPTLWGWCLVSRLLVSATLVEAPARFQPCWPLEPLDWRLSQTGGLAGLEQRNPKMNEEACHVPVFRVLFQISVLTLWKAESQLDSQEGLSPTHSWSPGVQLTRNGHRIRWGSSSRLWCRKILNQPQSMGKLVLQLPMKQFPP